MKGCMTTDLGIITVDPEVIAKYAGTVAVECFGIVGMAALNVKDGLVHLLKKETAVEQLENLNVILPPLSLQQAFAAKTEAIEKQKELVDYAKSMDGVRQVKSSEQVATTPLV